MNGFIIRKCCSRLDVTHLYEMMMSEDQYLFSTKITINSEDCFSNWLLEHMESDFHDFFVIADVDKNAPIGYVHNYDFSLQNGNCKIVVYIDAAYRSTGLGGYCAIKFMDYLFSEYPIRKIYVMIYAYNSDSLDSNLKAGFIEEGILKKYRYYNGMFYDLHILSMDRERFYNTLQGVINNKSVKFL